MRTGEVDFRFPVLGFTPDLDVWGFPDLRGLTTCGPRTLKTDMQIDMELVDADGHRWIVRSVRRVGRAGSLVSSLIRSLLTSVPQSRIEQELEAMAPLTRDETCARVCSSMEAHPEFWCEDDERQTVLPERLARVRAVKSIAEIHDVLGLDTFEAY